MNYSTQTFATFGKAIPEEQFNRIARVLRWTAELEQEIEREGVTSERLEGLRVGRQEARNRLSAVGYDGSQRRLLTCNEPVRVTPSMRTNR
jgi:hypothetical protein